MSVKNYRDLLVWQKSIDLVEDIYKITASYPREEIYGLVSQMKRASVSVPSNIAEGSSRRKTKEFIRFLDMSKGSLTEIETQAIISCRLNFLSKDENNKLLEKTAEISRMIWSLRKALESKLNSEEPVTT